MAPEGNFTEYAQYVYELKKITNLGGQQHLPGARELKCMFMLYSISGVNPCCTFF